MGAIEAATHIGGLRLSRRPDPARQLDELRPLGIGYLKRRFGQTMSHADMEDVVSEVVIRVHRRIERDGPPRNLQALFFASLHNAGVDDLRRKHARPAVSLELAEDEHAEGPTPLEAAEGAIGSGRLSEVLERMRPNYRDAVMLRYGLGMTIPEIASARGTSLSAAKKLVRRATEQARTRLEELGEPGFCAEMQSATRRALLGRELSGLSDLKERRVLNAHLSHCGQCRSYLAELKGTLHELGGTAILAGSAGTHTHLADRIPAAIEGVGQLPQLATEKLRLLAYRASGAFAPGEAASAGALGGTVQKVAAVCGAATASAATCLATGVIGPGIGAVNDSQHAPPPQSPPPITKQIEYAPAEEAPAPVAEPAPDPATSSTPTSAQDKAQEPAGSDPTPPPAQQAGEEFGFESTAPPSEPAPEPAPAPTPSAPAGSSSSSSAGGGGTENFGFGG